MADKFFHWAIAVLVVICCFCFPLRAFAAPSDFTYSSVTASTYVDFVHRPSDAHSHSSSTYNYIDWFETYFYFTFYTVDNVNVFSYPNTYLRYNFTFTSPTGVDDYTCEAVMIHNGVEYGLVRSNDGFSGYLTKSSSINSNGYFTIRVHMTGYFRYTDSFTSAEISANANHSVRKGLNTRMTMNTFDTFAGGDTISGIDSKINRLLDQGANVVGAIENQTDVIGDKLDEQNTIGQNIFDKISNFFNNFFDNITLTIRNIIVPTSAQLTEFLGRVNTWFSARLGFLWYPFDLAIRIVTVFAGGTQTSQFTVPALTLTLMGETYTIVNSTVIDMDEFGIFQYVRVLTSFLLVSWTISLAVDKWNEWIGGHTE